MTTLRETQGSTQQRVGSVQTLKNASPAVADGFRAMRDAIDNCGPLEPRIRELILLGGFTVARQEGGFKTHCRRALELGASPEEVRQAGLVTFGAITSLEAAADALRWADEVISSR